MFMEEFKIISNIAKVCKIRDHTGNVLQFQNAKYLKIVMEFLVFSNFRTYGNPASEQEKNVSMTNIS